MCVRVCACVCAGAMLKCQHAFPFPAAPLLPPQLALHMAAHVRRRRLRRRHRCPCRRCRRLPFAFCAQLPASLCHAPPDCLPVRAIEISTGAKVIQFNASPGDGQAGSSGSPGESLAYPYITCREAPEEGRGKGGRGCAAAGLLCAATGIAFKKLLS